MNKQHILSVLKTYIGINPNRTGMDKIKGILIGQVYVILAISSEIGVYYLWKEMIPWQTPTTAIVLSYMIAPIIAVTWGAVVVRAILILMSWITNIIIELFKTGLRK